VAVVGDDDLAAEDDGDFVWGQVACACEVAATAGVGVGEEPVAEGRVCVVRGEDDGGVIALGFCGGAGDLGTGEVFDREALDRHAGVAEPRVEEVGSDRPRSEYGRVGIVLCNVGDGLLVDNDHVAVGEVVLRREGGGWVEPECGDKRCGCEGGEDGYEVRAGSPGVDAEQQDEWVDREKIAR